MLLVIDSPAAGSSLDAGRVLVRGWAHHGRHPVARVTVTVAGMTVRAHLGRDRLDVAEFLEDPRAALAGYEVEIDLGGIAAGPLPIVVTAFSMDGTTRVSTSTQVEVEPARSAIPDVPALAWPPLRRPRRRLVRPRPLRLLVAARSLDLGGSQLRMAEFAEGIAGDDACHLTVISPLEGPLRARLEAAGATVEITPEIRHDDPGQYAEGVRDLGRGLDGRFDVAYAFTLTGFAALDAAGQVGIPTVLRVGENERLEVVAAWIGMALHPAVSARAQEVIEAASQVTFNSRAGLVAHRDHGLRGRFAVLHNGIDLAQAAGARTPGSKADARARLGVPPGARLLLLPATLWPVKGQGNLVHALATLAGKHPDLAVVLVGAAHRPYADAVRRVADSHGLGERVRMEPFADDLGPWWHASDLLVCSSETEAAPAILLEAGAHRLPVVSTSVGFAPELVERGRSGWLCRPDSVRDLARVLDLAARASSTHLEEMGRRLHARVVEEHDLAANLRSTRRMLRRASAGRRPM